MPKTISCIILCISENRMEICSEVFEFIAIAQTDDAGILFYNIYRFNLTYFILTFKKFIFNTHFPIQISLKFHYLIDSIIKNKYFIYKSLTFHVHHINPHKLRDHRMNVRRSAETRHRSHLSTLRLIVNHGPLAVA